VNLLDKKQQTDDDVPGWLGKAAVWSLVGTLAIIGITLIVILIGATNPKPVGTLVMDQTYKEIVAVRAMDAETPVTSATLAVFTPPGTVEITAHQISGPPDAAFGIWWGTAPDIGYTFTGANSNGYIGSYRVEEDGLLPIEDWHRWPWVNAQGESNRFWVDFVDGQAQVRINEEVAVTFAWDDLGAQQVGLFVMPMQAGESTVQVERVRVWQTAYSK